MTHPQSAKPHTSLAFCPFQDVLAIGHAAGISCILVPGAGEPNFDSTEADPFESSKARREREIKSLLDKIQPDMIALDPELLGSFAPQSKLTEGKDPGTVPFARQPRLDRLRMQGKADETDGVSESDAVVESPACSSDSPNRDRMGPERRKTRGKGKSLKRYLRKQRKNVINPKAIAVRDALVKKQTRTRSVENDYMESEQRSALDRFHHRR